VELSAGSLRQGFEELFKRYPDLRRQLCSEDGSIRSFVNVYLNDEDIRYLGSEPGSADLGQPFSIENEHVKITYSPPIGNGDVISIVPSIAGGFVSWGRRQPRAHRVFFNWRLPSTSDLYTIDVGNRPCTRTSVCMAAFARQNFGEEGRKMKC